MHFITRFIFYISYEDSYNSNRRKPKEAKEVETAKKLPFIDDELIVGAAVGAGALRRSRERVMVGLTTEVYSVVIPSALSLTMHRTNCSDFCSA